MYLAGTIHHCRLSKNRAHVDGILKEVLIGQGCAGLAESNALAANRSFAASGLRGISVEALQPSDV